MHCKPYLNLYSTDAVRRRGQQAFSNGDDFGIIPWNVDCRQVIYKSPSPCNFRSSLFLFARVHAARITASIDLAEASQTLEMENSNFRVTASVIFQVSLSAQRSWLRNHNLICREKKFQIGQVIGTWQMPRQYGRCYLTLRPCLRR